MKNGLNIILSLLVMVIAGSAMGQAAPPSGNVATKSSIEAIEYERLPANEYNQEALYWEGEVTKSSLNEVAWLNLYKAKRYGAYTDHSKKITKDKQAELDAIVTRMNAAIPNSFALQYSQYLNKNKSDDSFSHLRAAYNINPNEAELYDDMLCDAEIRNDQAAIKKFAALLSNQDFYNISEVEYNKNVLNSIEQNGILITGGNVDTYPLILMQQLQGFRTDVKIICTDWLQSETYRKQVAALLGLKIAETVSAEKLIGAKTTGSMYVALTVSPELIQKNAGHLYCTGLAMKFSKNSLQNLESLAYNWEYLFEKKNMHSTEALNKNYLLPLFLLRQYYQEHGRLDAADEVQQNVLQITQRFALEKQVKKHLD